MSVPNTRVQIFGEEYSVDADLDPAYVRMLADYVDKKLNAVAEMAPMMDKKRMAVLAALAIADELHTTMEEEGEQDAALKERAERCLALVERALGEKQ
jgi:cell division protein ZapA